MKRTRPIIIVLGLCLCIGLGLGYLDTTQEGTTSSHQLVGAMAPGDPSSEVVYTTGIWPQGWISTGGGPQDAAVIHIIDKTPVSQTLEFKLPGFYHDDVVISGQNCSRIDVPGLLKIQVPGMPELPITSSTLVIPADGVTTLKVIEHKVREIKVHPVEPSLGHLTRNINPATVTPIFSDFYEKGGVWPKRETELSGTFNIREYTGINVRLNPLRWDANKGVLLVTEHILFEVVTEGGNPKIPDIAVIDSGSPSGFAGVHERLFANYETPDLANKYQHLPTQGRMLIVAHDAFVGHLQPFVQWKQQRGFDVTVVTVSELGGTSNGIASGIEAMYDEPQSLTYVILVGDKAQVPTMVGLFDGSDSDSRYAMVGGSDIYPDLFISRISASNVTQLATQVNKFIAYEKQPVTGAHSEWYSKAAGVASDEGTPSDFKRADFLRDDLLEFGFAPVEQIYQGLGGNTIGIRDAVEKGCSIVNYLGHGSGYGWTSVYFSSSDVRQLQNYNMWPWIIDVSCSNGDFAIDECFAEAWLRAGTPEAPTGAIAMIASSSLAPWVPPTVMQAEAIDLLVGDQANTIGSLYYSGLMRVLDSYGNDEVARQVMEQNIIFGDCSLMVRTREPEEYVVPVVPALDAQASSWSFSLSGPEGSVATLTTSEGLHGSGVVDATGRAVIPMLTPVDGRSPVTLTITGYNMVPYIQTVSVTNGSGGDDVSPEPEPTPEPVLPVEVALHGNYPNPFNPSTRIAFDLPRDMMVNLSVFDIRGSLVKTLLSETTSAGRQEVLWDGKDSTGRTAASGVYLYQLITPEGQFSGRMLLTK